MGTNISVLIFMALMGKFYHDAHLAHPCRPLSFPLLPEKKTVAAMPDGIGRHGPYELFSVFRCCR